MRKANLEGREIDGIVIKGKARLYMRFQKGEALKKAFPRRGQRCTRPSRRDFSRETTEHAAERYGGLNTSSAVLFLVKLYSISLLNLYIVSRTYKISKLIENHRLIQTYDDIISMFSQILDIFLIFLDVSENE